MKKSKSTVALYSGCSKYRCVPKMASPEARKCICTTAPQGQRPEISAPQGQRPEIQAPSLVRGECTTAPQGQRPEI